jgi:hypothetical protein
MGWHNNSSNPTPQVTDNSLAIQALSLLTLSWAFQKLYTMMVQAAKWFGNGSAGSAWIA